MCMYNTYVTDTKGSTKYETVGKSGTRIIKNLYAEDGGSLSLEALL